MATRKFYESKAWKRVRLNICLAQSCLCARCGRACYVDGLSSYVPKEKRLIGIVHHKEYINDENESNDLIILDENNLELLCIDCHNKEHKKVNDITRNDLMFDENGQLVESLH